MTIQWRKQYVERDRDAVLGDYSAVVFDPEEDRAVQSYKEDCDINTLVRRFGVTGELPRASVQPFYGDFSSVPDYQTALNMIREANDSFRGLPASVRRRFENDPGRLMAFLQDESNRSEAEQLGLVPKPASVVPVPLESPGGDDPAL